MRTSPRLLRLFVGLTLLIVALPTNGAFATSPGAWQTTGSLTTPRALPLAVKLSNGNVLVSGGFTAGADFLNLTSVVASAEVFNVATGVWQSTGSMVAARAGQQGVLLAGGKVLAVGGTDANGNALASAERYNPTTGAWTATGGMQIARSRHTATLLQNGRVLVVGGATSTVAELYDPLTGVWSSAGGLAAARFDHSATRLSDGRVLVAGGANAAGSPLASAEIYNPVTNSWSPAAPMTVARQLHSAVLLNNGKVLVAGGVQLQSSELYNPSSNSWSPTGGMLVNHALNDVLPSSAAGAVLLDNGQVLMAGGDGTEFVEQSTTEVFDPATGAWNVRERMIEQRSGGRTVKLDDGRILAIGGYGIRCDGLDCNMPVVEPLASVELFDLALVGNEPPLIGSGPVPALVANKRLQRVGDVDAGVPLQLSWGAASDVDGIASYQVFVQTDAFPSQVCDAETFAGSVTSTICTHFDGSEYRYSVRAIDTLGESSTTARGPFFRPELVEEGDPAVTYVGPWQSAAPEYASNGSLRQANTSASRASFQFSGASVGWATTFGPNRGKAEVWLDGVKVRTVDLYAPLTSYRKLAVVINGVAGGNHTFEVRVLGKKNPLSSGTRVDVDAFATLVQF